MAEITKHGIYYSEKTKCVLIVPVIEDPVEIRCPECIQPIVLSLSRWNDILTDADQVNADMGVCTSETQIRRKRGAGK